MLVMFVNCEIFPNVWTRRNSGFSHYIGRLGKILTPPSPSDVRLSEGLGKNPSFAPNRPRDVGKFQVLPLCMPMGIVKILRSVGE